MTNPYGEAVADGSLDDCISLDYSRREFEVGKLQIVLPIHHSPTKFRWHNRIYVFYEGGMEGETFWLLQKVSIEMDSSGGMVWVIIATDLMILPKSRHAIMYADTPYTLKVGEVGNVLEEIVRENLGEDATTGLIATNPARDISSLLEIQGVEVTTPLVYKAFAYQNILSTMVKVCQDSIERGMYVGFDFTANTQDRIAFRIYINQRGRDLRETVVLALAYESLTGAKYTENHEDVVTAVAAAGQGEEISRDVVYVVDQDRINQSPFGYIEGFKDARNLSDIDRLTTEANTVLNEGRPYIVVQVNLEERPGALFGVDFGFGDRVSVQIDDKFFECRIAAYRVSVQGNERKVQVSLEGTPRIKRLLSGQMRQVLGEIEYLTQNETP